jgi:hypothetical protein
MHPLEKRREMSGTFPGRIVLVEGDEVDVDLQIAAEKIRLATPFAEIGLWDRDAIHFERNSTGGYELSVADDVVTFYPADVDGFAEAVSEMLDDVEAPAEEVPLPPVSLVPRLLQDDSPRGGEDRSSQGVEATDEEPAARFGPSSRERLAAAMSGFRERQQEEVAEAETSAEADLEARSRPSSPGFVIPGDDGYIHPADEEYHEDRHSIHFDEELEEDTVADQVLETSRTLRGASSLAFDRDKLKKIAIGVGVVAVLVALAFAVPVVIDFFSGSDDDTSPATASPTTLPVTAPQQTTAPTTETTAVETTAVAAPLSFALTSEGFVERWNETAALVSPSLRFRSSLPAGDFEVGFTSYIAMIGSGEGGGVAAFTIEIDPTGPSSSDQLGIQALGLAIAVADPSLEPGERAAILGAMGLNVRDPDLGGLDGATTRNGVDYRLLFDSEDVVLRLTVAPSSP